MSMNPHSHVSQFNHRVPKSGPFLQHIRTPQADNKLVTNYSSPGPDCYSKKETASKIRSTVMSLSTVERPISSNSRVRSDERHHKDMYLAFVNNALRQQAEGFNEPFEELVGQFSPDQSFTYQGATAQMRLWITALSHVVSKLDRQHAPLVDAIIALPWTTMDMTFVKSYVAFIGMLASARPEYLQRIIDKIVQSLTHQSGLQALDTGIPESSTTPLTRRVVYDRLHTLLQHLLSLIPTMVNILYPILVRHFPHKRQSIATHVTYIRNTLRISDYCPGLSDRIMSLVIDRTIQIDVEIQVEMEELESGLDTEIFTLDPFDTVVGQDSDSDSGDSEGDEMDDLSDMSSDVGVTEDSVEAPIDSAANMSHMQDIVKKLDIILDVIFDHLSHTHSISTFTTISSSPWVDSERSSLVVDANDLETVSSMTHVNIKALQRTKFQTLLSIFDRTIIRTFKSRYTQFLVFWYSSLDPEFTDVFQGYLISKALLEEDQPVVTRAAAASYIASFVSRAQFVDRASARRVVGILCDFLDNYLAKSISYVAGQNSDFALSMSQSTIFYAVVQAVFLIFCFRWRDLLEDDDDETDVDLGATIVGSQGLRKWMRELNVVQRVINSPLNPLLMCSANVVQQFARVAQHVDFVYCFSILEANKRQDNSSSSANTNISHQDRIKQYSRMMGLSAEVDLTTFFPFDPYKLPKSNSYIQGIYREWSSVAVGDEDDSEDEDEEIDGYDMKPYENSGISVAQSSMDHDDDSEGLGESFGGMSISPVRGLIPVS